MGKDFFQSKQTWGAILYLLGPIIGVELDVDAMVNTIVEVIAGGIFLWGSFSRNRAPVTSVAGVPVK